MNYRYTIIFYILLVFFQYVVGKTIYIVPIPGYANPDALFDLTDRDGCKKPFYELRAALHKLGYGVQTTTLEKPLQDFEIVLVFDAIWGASLEQLKHYPHEKCILFIWEPPTTRPDNYNTAMHESYTKIYTMIDNIVDGKKYNKFFYPQPTLTMTEEIIPFNNKKLCTMIAMGKRFQLHPWQLYTKRIEAVQFFSHYPQDFDLYGMHWPQHFSVCYKGAVKSKKEVLKQYKFALCYENMQNARGYVTEKIFDCMIAGCVPIYWGAANIDTYIPANCFIDRRRFSSDQQLYNFLKSMPEQTYNAYLNNIRLFLESDAAFLFSIPYFIHTVASLIQPNYAMSEIFDHDTQLKIKRAQLLAKQKGIEK